MGHLFFARRAILTNGRAKTAINEKTKSVVFYLEPIHRDMSLITLLGNGEIWPSAFFWRPYFTENLAFSKT